jgi:DNA-binding NtrC family response regulator
MACLLGHDWPGNVRELRNVIERVMILENREEIDVVDLPEEIALRDFGTDDDESEGAGEQAGADGVPPSMALPEGGLSLRDLQRELVRQALERTGGNQTRAARLLRISRDALRYKMKTYRLS